MNISDVQDGLQTVSIGVFAMRRLENVNKTVIELQVGHLLQTLYLNNDESVISIVQHLI